MPGLESSVRAFLVAGGSMDADLTSLTATAVVVAAEVVKSTAEMAHFQYKNGIRFSY